MLKVVVFDSGYGGEAFADKLEAEIPVIKVIRVIDWRNADKILTSARQAREMAIKALRPYIGKVDLIIFANHLLTLTSLKYFSKKYRSQRFIGLNLKEPDTFVDRDILILSTKAVASTLGFRYLILKLHRKSATLLVDSWFNKIDDGELEEDEIRSTISSFIASKNIQPEEVILAGSQFSDIKAELGNVLGRNIKIYDSFEDAIRNAGKILKIKGSVKKLK